MQLLFLPEASDYISPRPDPTLCTEDFVRSLCSLAAAHSLPVLVGVHTLSRGHTKPYNTLAYITATGQIQDYYHKLHLFDIDLPGTVLKESNSTTPGEKLFPPIDTPIGKVGLQICFDLRFSKTAAALRSAGAQVLVYPSAFTVETGAAHWEVLLRARAIEMQCWVIAPAQCGWHFEEGVGERCSYGDSMVVDPWGRVIARAGRIEVGEKRRTVNPELLVCEVDADMCEEVRRRVPMHPKGYLWGFPGERW